MKKTAILFVILALAASVPAQNAPQGAQAGSGTAVPLRFDHYYTLEQVYDAVQALAKAYPEMTKVEEAGKSEEGRPIYAVTVTNPKTGPALSKPGIYVDGNSAQPVRWLVRAEKPVKVERKATTRLAWGDAKTIDLGGAK